MKVAIPLYDRFTALDAVGPYEVIQRIPGAEITWLAHAPGLVGTDTGQLRLHADAAFEDLPDPDIVVVPGGTGTDDFRLDPQGPRDLAVDDLRLHRVAAARRRRRAGRPGGDQPLARHRFPRALRGKPD